MNSAISLRAAAEDLARRSARAASLARSATSIASSLRRERPVSRERVDPLAAAAAASVYATSTPPPRRRRPKISDSETRHSIAVISPSLSVSMAAMAASRRAGTSRYCKFSLPQLMRNKTTGLLCSLTASTCVEIKFERPTPSTRDSS